MSQNGEHFNEREGDYPVVFEVYGEPAVVINGLPKNKSCKKKPLLSRDARRKQADDPFFGKLLEGRNVRKLFGGHYYHGEVVKYDSEVNWYRVVYEDGDFEDIEWHELEEVLLPLDINIPLKLLPFQSFLHNKYYSGSKFIMERTLEPCQISQQIYDVPVQIDYKSVINWGDVTVQANMEE
ncbi:dirigent protein 17-like [Phalaenopsis equestris]|uniref:dirigent protein 17-like n=1 Tax=Phalaenopsis equestris TaxID=78828 RepID=UPI0009E2B63D|nr:dirigent protein 17-like [Phalaenopsis equestris]